MKRMYRSAFSLFLAGCMLTASILLPSAAYAVQEDAAWPVVTLNAESQEDPSLEAARRLYALGLFRGTGTDGSSNPVFELDRAPDRNESVTMLVRLLGLEEEALSTVCTVPFTDLDGWAAPYVGTAYTKGLTTGTSADSFDGKRTVKASEYLTFLLRALGYESGVDFAWNRAWELSDLLGITHGEYNAGSVFLRGDAAIVSERALGITVKDSNQTLMEKLVCEGVVPAEADVTGQIMEEASNRSRILALSKERGVQVLTGSEAYLWIAGSPVTGIADPELIARWLDVIEEQLSRYPEDFFKDMRDVTDCRIFLMDGLPGNLSGFTSYEFGDHVSISLNASQVVLTSDRTLNHEIMHFIGHYIEVKSGGTDALFTIADMVPSVPYDISGNSWTCYDSGRDISDVYFITPYAKTSPSEDMAETFADAMFRSYRKEYMKDPACPIYRKMNLIAQSIRSSIPSAANTAPGSLAWEKWL